MSEDFEREIGLEGNEEYTKVRESESIIVSGTIIKQEPKDEDIFDSQGPGDESCSQEED